MTEILIEIQSGYQFALKMLRIAEFELKMVLRFYRKLEQANLEYNSIILNCVPTHCGIRGNEMADILSKDANECLDPIWQQQNLC